MIKTKQKFLFNFILHKFSNKTFSTTFPYEFGRNIRLNKEKIPMKEINQDLTEGIKFIYKNCIYAIYEKDFDYFQENCEKGFYSKLKESLLQITNKSQDDKNKNELFLYDIKPEITIDSVFIENYAGLRINRELNVGKKEVKIGNSFFNNMRQSIPIKLYFYEPVKKDELKYTCRIHIDIMTNLKLSNFNIEDNNFEIHNMIIEME
jgi:hypothetical protein